jgi:hypothetical protein
VEKDKKKIPTEFRSLFWEVDVNNINLEAHANYVIERFLEYGTWEGIRWLRTIYADDQLICFIKEKSFRLRSPKTLNFWRLMLNIPENEWTNPLSRLPSERSSKNLGQRS